MAFHKLQRLGEEKFTKILNALMRGDSCRKVSRMIQQAPPAGWGDLPDMGEEALAQSLNRLRAVSAEGAYGKDAAKRILAVHKPHVDRLAHVSVRVLERMEELSEKKRGLVNALLDKATHDVMTYKSVNDAVDVYRQILLDVQKLRFDLGLDEFKGPVGGTTSIKGAIQTTTFPDGMSVQKQVFEAVSVVEEIFNARRVPHLRPREYETP